jgi:hypothetical protein
VTCPRQLCVCRYLRCRYLADFSFSSAALWVQIYLVADSALPSHTGLAPHCGSFSQAAATAATAAALPTADVAASCPAALQLSCAQAQLRADSPVLQSGSLLTWPLNTSSSSGTLEWLRPAGPSAARRPAKVQLSLEGGAAPAFLWGPTFPAELRTASSIGMQFGLDKPALLIYAGVFLCWLPCCYS